MTLIDISRPIHTGMPVWPGDVPTQFDLTSLEGGGSAINVGQLRTSLHAGTHADAPFHYDNTGEPIDRVPLHRYLGPARVVDARGCECLSASLLAGVSMAEAPRILFRTDSWRNPAVFPEEWPPLDPELPAWLGAQGVLLLGLDVPSVDPIRSKELACHHALHQAGVAIVENLDLRGVEPGVYEFIGLPLRVSAGDAAPLRAVLRRP
jgi:arylformamidase